MAQLPDTIETPVKPSAQQVASVRHNLDLVQISSTHGASVIGVRLKRGGREILGDGSLGDVVPPADMPPRFGLDSSMGLTLDREDAEQMAEQITFTDPVSGQNVTISVGGLVAAVTGYGLKQFAEHDAASEG